MYAAAISTAMLCGVSVMHTVPITESYAVPRDSLDLILFGREPSDHLKQPRQICSTASSILTPSWKFEHSGEHPSRCPASSAETIFTRVIEQIAAVLLVRGQKRPCHPSRARVQVPTDAGHERARPSDHREIVEPRARVLAVILGSVIQSVREGSSRAVLRWCVVLGLGSIAGRPGAGCKYWANAQRSGPDQFVSNIGHIVEISATTRSSPGQRLWPGYKVLLRQALSRSLGAGEVGRLGNPPSFSWVPAGGAFLRIWWCLSVLPISRTSSALVVAVAGPRPLIMDML